MPTKPRRKRPTNYMKQADRAFSVMIRNRDGQCLNCGAVSRLQCAHIISRSYKTIRCDPENAVTLCQSCHLYFTHRQLEWEIWVEDRFPGRYVRLRNRALTYERVDWRRAVAELKEYRP